MSEAPQLFSHYDLRPPAADPRRALTAPGAVIDLFAGPGGWDEGLRAAGHTGPAVGIETSAAACATAEAAGHLRLHGDVLAQPLDGLSPEGIIGSPPCPGFSAAGLQQGRDDLPAIRARIDAHALGAAPEAAACADPRSPLTAEPMRWAAALRPAWLALEQVPAVLPVWQHMAAALGRLGYSAWCGLLEAADYGVPQTRTRAVLLASRARPVQPPPPTHAQHGSGGLPGWRSMADACGWPPGLVGFPRRADEQPRVLLAGAAYRARDLRPTSQPAFTLTEKARSWRRWAGPADPAPQPLSVAEAAALQAFRPGYPWAGTRSARFHQIGNAVPPPLGAACLRMLLG